MLKTFTLLIILLFFSINNSTGQSACSYSESEITIMFNGWEINRIDYTHERFIEVAGLGHNSQLDYSGEKDTCMLPLIRTVYSYNLFTNLLF